MDNPRRPLALQEFEQPPEMALVNLLGRPGRVSAGRTSCKESSRRSEPITPVKSKTDKPAGMCSK